MFVLGSVDNFGFLLYLLPERVHIGHCFSIQGVSLLKITLYQRNNEKRNVKFRYSQFLKIVI